MRESTIADVVGAFLENRVNHTPKSVIEHRSLTTHNDPVAHFAGIHGEIVSNQHERVSQAMIEFKNANGSYIDVHAWQFLPNTFIEIINQLKLLGLTEFEVQMMYETQVNTQEFFVMLSI